MLIDKYAGGDTLMPIYSDKDINLYLKDIAILCHIDKRITYHTARHTFASTVTLANNISLIVVSKMLGHSNTRMTEHYAKLVDKCIGEDMDKLMGTFCTKEWCNEAFTLIYNAALLHNGVALFIFTALIQIWHDNLLNTNSRVEDVRAYTGRMLWLQTCHVLKWTTSSIPPSLP